MDWLYPLAAALSAAAMVLLADDGITWSLALLQQVNKVLGVLRVHIIVLPVLMTCTPCSGATQHIHS